MGRSRNRRSGRGRRSTANTVVRSGVYTLSNVRPVSPGTFHSRRLKSLHARFGPEYLRQLEDRRTWYPARYRPVAVIPGARTSTRPNRLVQGFRSLQFAYPPHVLICVRRRIRREVLLALGRGGAGHKKPRRNEYSDVHC